MEELISQALQEDMHIVVLALYVLGTVLKRIKAVPDCLIPVFLAGIGMVLGFLVLVVNLCSLHTLGTPLTAPIAPWQPRTLRDLFWRSGWQRLGQEDYNVSSARQRERGQTDDQDA